MMKQYFLLLFAFVGPLSMLNAQYLLVFPEKDAHLMSNITLDACVRQSSEMMDQVDLSDVSQADEFQAQGRMLLHLGQHEYAKEAFEKALAINNQAYGKEDIRYVKALIDLARAYMLLIRYTEAAGMYKEALTTIEKIKGKNSIEYLATLNENVLVHTRISHWPEAIQLAQKGIEILKKEGKENSIYYAIYQNNLGACIRNTYDFQTATKHYEIARQAAKGNQSIMVSLAANIAETYAYTGKVAEAQALLAKYVPIAKTVLSSKNLTLARIWMQYGVAFTALKEFDKAEACFKEAFITNSLTLTDLSSIPDQAEDLMFNNTYLATCGQCGIMMYSVELYKQKYEATGDIEVLKEGYKIVKAINKYGEKLMNSYLSEENKLIIFRLGATILFDRSLFYAYELYQKTKDPQYLEDAFFYSERSKSTLLVNALRSKENQSFLQLPDDLLQKEKDLKAKLKNLQKAQIEAATVDAREKIQQSINDLNIQIEQFKENLQKKYPEYYQHRYNIALSNLKATQDFLAKNDNILIEYALGLEKHYAFVVTKNSLDIIHLQFDPFEYNKQTVNLRKTLTNYRFITKNAEKADSLFVTSSRYFYNTFMEPMLAKVKKGQHLIIVPDQSLGHLPFETFLSADPKTIGNYADYPYLIKDYPISYSYSSTILLGQERHQERRSIPKEGVLAFAAEYPEVLDNNSYSHQRGGNIGVVREGLSPLPGAQKEVEMMSKHLYGEFHNGITASENNFKQNAKNYGIIHLAMHGVLDNNNPILSSLVFSEDSSEHEDNFLRAYEIAQLDLNADLVVLSACETGYGKFTQGEGVMSLAHSFSYAGASSILMSLWQVNDYSTSQIMKHFYINLATGKSKENALRDAKLSYLKNTENTRALHPAFWAAFVQTGDVEPLTLLAKSGKSFQTMGRLLIGGAVLLLLGIGFGIYSFRKKRQAA